MQLTVCGELPRSNAASACRHTGDAHSTDTLVDTQKHSTERTTSSPGQCMSVHTLQSLTMPLLLPRVLCKHVLREHVLRERVLPLLHLSRASPSPPPHSPMQGWLSAVSSQYRGPCGTWHVM